MSFHANLTLYGPTFGLKKGQSVGKEVVIIDAPSFSLSTSFPSLNKLLPFGNRFLISLKA